MKEATVIELTPEEEETLRSWVRSGRTEQRLADRARYVLAASEGLGTNEIARQYDVRPATVSKWRTRFVTKRLAGLRDAPRPGARRVYGEQDEQRVLKKLDDSPPDGRSSWTGDLLAGELGYSRDYVYRVLRRNKIHLQRRRSWCLSTDPEFAAKAADIIALYLNPPDNAVVLCVDEKPAIQALERDQGWLRLADGTALRGIGHEYKRHGTITLFAALQVATGVVSHGFYKRRRRREFLHFMNDVVGDYPDQDIHVILDNLSTHKPKRDLWLARHPRVHFHFTPTHASWLSLIECWFSVLQRQVLKGASWTHPKQIVEAVDAYVSAANDNPTPFEWRKTEVRPTGLTAHYADLRD